MFDTTDELLRKIRLGEDSVLELKAVRFRGKKIAGPERDDLADELAAMANTADGVVLLGVDDKTRRIEASPWSSSTRWRATSGRSATTASSRR
jgi:predicted HTH transcriptional regulator